ncbi:MAG: hypothetical protein KGI89_07330 [Euryarchaeota archaeon]|nr:hypothetical protein [Euryarchaeota archaeon]
MAVAVVAPEATLTPELKARSEALHDLVVSAVRRAPAESIQLSGGLDTSVLAQVAKPQGLRWAFTVLVGKDPPDQDYAQHVAKRLGLEHHEVHTDLEGILEEVPFVVKVMRTFDPMEVRNSIVVARGLREAKALGVSATLTGDAADELFGGYSFLWPKSEEEFARSSDRMARVMRFSSFPMGEALGVQVHAPYMDPEIVAFSRRLSKAEKVASVDGVTHGKFLLRLAFPEVPNRWRRKDPIEVGSGSARLTEHFRTTITKREFERERERVLREDQVEIRDPEHLAYYRVFGEVFGERPPLTRHGKDPCPKCGYELPSPESNFCVTCGAWPARVRKESDTPSA